MKQSMLVLASVGLGLLSVPLSTPVRAADMVVKGRHVAAADCGPCGCLRVTYDHHREVLSTYGPSYDPRNFDQTQPYFFLGRMRAYPQYYVDGGPCHD
jgi:hypothetical protein